MSYEMDEPLQRTLVDAAHFLDGERVQYALIGGLAVSLHGQPRVTADVDMVILADVPQSLSLLSRLAKSRFKPLFDGVAEVVEKSFILPLRHRITNVKVDLALGLSGFEQQLLQRAELVTVADTEITVATAEDLLLMKILAGRPQDDQDAQGLVVAQGKKLDWTYCLNVATELGEAVGQNLAMRVRSMRDQYGA
jgi:hypothetical protein